MQTSAKIVEIVFTVPGQPVPKPRMTQRDRWKKRPVVMNFRAWADSVRWAYKLAGGKMFSVCRMGFRFYVAGHPDSDLDNYIKGAKDALTGTGMAFENDKALIVRGYYDEPEVVFLCDNCNMRERFSRGPQVGELKPDCGAVAKCELAKSVIKIRGILK